MSDFSSFESRVGKLDACAEDVYLFAADIRNFEKFIPQDKVSNVVVNKESCSFTVQGVGGVDVSIDKMQPYNQLIYKGMVFQNMEFFIVLDITEVSIGKVEVKVSAQAQLNPVLKMMIAEPLKNFLELLVAAMENFNEWKS